MDTDRRRSTDEWTPQNVERPSRTPYRRTRDSGETQAMPRSHPLAEPARVADDATDE